MSQQSLSHLGFVSLLSLAMAEHVCGARAARGGIAVPCCQSWLKTAVCLSFTPHRPGGSIQR